jgi:hypothetical protein
MDNLKNIWDSYSFETDEVKFWRIGPLQMWILYTGLEWRLFLESTEDPLESGQEFNPHSELPLEIENKLIKRFAIKGGRNLITLRPSLADRPMVARPEYPFYVPANKQTTLYISTPLWIKLMVNGEGILLDNIPPYRPSDTWFGKSPVEGEFCYGIQTAARLNILEIPLRQHRAITSIHIKNSSKEPLLLERLKIPIPSMSLFKAESGWYYTEDINFEKESSGEGVKVKFNDSPTGFEGEYEKVNGPGAKGPKNFVVNTFKNLFS